MLYREIIAVCSQIHTEHINTLCNVVQHFTCAVYCFQKLRVLHPNDREGLCFQEAGKCVPHCTMSQKTVFPIVL